MAVKNFKTIDVANDVTTTRTLLHEAIPVTGSIISSGTYNNNNIKNYTHGMFQSVYDYPYLSSSANHIFDIAVCYPASSSLSSAASVQNDKKINMYTEFAQTLLGYTGSLTDPANQVQFFENDEFAKPTTRGPMLDAVFVVNFSRLLTKDQIKKGTFSMNLMSGAFNYPFVTGTSGCTLTDASASSDGTGVFNGLGGDYAILYSDKHEQSPAKGFVFYQAGIAVITGGVFNEPISGESISDFYTSSAGHAVPTGQKKNFDQMLTGTSVSGACDSIRQRIDNISFNNTTEINSKIYFCRVPHNMFNYSSNPTYLSGSKIRVKNVASDQPISYITTIGLYNSSNELLAVAKLSEPLRKDPTNDITLRVRLDY
jgi:hypothetical protein